MIFTDDDVVSPQLYADESRLHAMFAEIRQKDPVRWTHPTNYRPFWTITKHADVMEIEHNSEIFRAGKRNLLLPIEEEQRIFSETGGAPRNRSLPTMDSPDHLKYRAVTSQWFRPANLQRLEAKVETLVDTYLDRMAVGTGVMDFVKDVSLWIPLRTIMLILGVPEKDALLMHRLTGELFTLHDPDTARQGGGGTSLEARAEFFTYFQALLSERRSAPREDLLSVIAAASIDDSPIGEAEALAYCVSIVAAGHDTTASTISGGLHALISNPVQHDKLIDDPSLVLRAVEEMLRFVSPVRNFMRTAERDYQLRNKTVRAGDAVMTVFPSANRDEEVFEHPDAFIVDRRNNPHLAFGAGPHRCLGMALARMELTKFFEGYVARRGRAKLAGPTSWMQANFLGGPKVMPIQCSFD